EIINTLDKRPLTLQDIELLFDEESKKRLLQLIENKEIVVRKLDNLEFFIPYQNIQRKKSK
ncbi:MAG: radical SAM protein, partial [Sulfurimonas sp.]